MICVWSDASDEWNVASVPKHTGLKTAQVCWSVNTLGNALQGAFLKRNE